MEETEETKNIFIRTVYQMIYEWRFEELINLINEKYPSFFNINENIFYIIMKFNFIKIILFQHDIQAAKDFYSQYLLKIMKKIYGNKSSLYNKKHFKYQHFLNQINNHDKYSHFQQHFKYQVHLDKFLNILEKYLQKEITPEPNPVIFNVTKLNNNNNKINNNDKPLFKTERVNIITYNHENMSEIEDELFKLNLGETKKNIFSVYSYNDKNMNKNNIYINNNNSLDIDINSNNNGDYNNSSEISNSFPELNNYRNKIDSKKFIEKNEFSSLNNKEKSSFNSKIRRVNLCKKIVRKFKKYLKTNKKEINYSFWNSFCRENYLPPFKIEDIEFKSFSKIYLNWLFTHEGGVELYNEFIRNKGEEELNNIYSSYGINDIEEREDLKNFFNKFAIFFSNLKKNENDNCNENINQKNDNNNEFNNGKVFQADFANNFFDNYLYNKEENLSVGSINNFYEEGRNNYKEYKRSRKSREFDVFNRILASDSSNSSMENANNEYNINDNINNNNYNSEFKKNYDFNNAGNYHVDEFSINPNESNNKNFGNKDDENNIYPDINYFEFNKDNNINASFSHYIFNNEDNLYNKKSDNLKED